MFTAADLIAKVVVFIVQKVGGKLVDLPFDNRRKACRSLTKLYYCLEYLDDATHDFAETLKFQKEFSRTSALVNALVHHMRDLELASNMFINLGAELRAGLEIVDPALAQCCDLLYISKYDFLTFISDCIRYDRSATPARMIVKKPQGRLLTVDMDDMYERARRALDAGDKYYWPDSLFYEFTSDFVDLTVEIEDDGAAADLEAIILRQNALLSEARVRLRNLLIANFKVEELLFQPDSHPYRDS